MKRMRVMLNYTAVIMLGYIFVSHVLIDRKIDLIMEKANYYNLQLSQFNKPKQETIVISDNVSEEKLKSISYLFEELNKKISSQGELLLSLKDAKSNSFHETEKKKSYILSSEHLENINNANVIISNAKEQGVWTSIDSKRYKETISVLPHDERLEAQILLADAINKDSFKIEGNFELDF